MLKREDFVFTIGYDGHSAVVDGNEKREFKNLTTAELAEKGLFQAAWASAVYQAAWGDPQAGTAEKAAVVEKYNAVAGTSYPPDADLGKLFGVVPVDVKRAIVL
jgi:hypothetical protein